MLSGGNRTQIKPRCRAPQDSDYSSCRVNVRSCLQARNPFYETKGVRSYDRLQYRPLCIIPFRYYRMTKSASMSADSTCIYSPSLHGHTRFSTRYRVVLPTRGRTTPGAMNPLCWMSCSGGSKCNAGENLYVRSTFATIERGIGSYRICGNTTTRSRAYRVCIRLESWDDNMDHNVSLYL